jgi:hypothetical protein
VLREPVLVRGTFVGTSGGKSSCVVRYLSTVVIDGREQYNVVARLRLNGKLNRQ